MAISWGPHTRSICHLTFSVTLAESVYVLADYWLEQQKRINLCFLCFFTDRFFPATADAIDRARLARERREAEQRKRLDELRAHAAAAQAQRERRDEERRRRQAEQRAKDDDRRVQVSSNSLWRLFL